MNYSDEKDLSNFKKVNTSSWNTIKDNVYIRLMNAKYIPSYNEDIAFIKKLDLAITFSVQEVITEQSKKKMLSHMLTNQELKDMDIDIDTVYRDTLQNTAQNRKRRVMTFKEYTIMHSTLYPMLTIPKGMMMGSGGENIQSCGVLEDVTYDYEHNTETENILMVTNKNDAFGACYMIVPEILEEVYDRFGENFYIIPMSIHCVMCVRSNYVTKNNTKPLYAVEDDILDTVEDFNDTHNKSWKDILSYKAYYYFGDDGKFILPISTH